MKIFENAVVKRNGDDHVGSYSQSGGIRNQLRVMATTAYVKSGGRKEDNDGL
jgi:hypothetical protein